MIWITDYADAGEHKLLLLEVFKALGYFCTWSGFEWELYNSYEDFPFDPIASDKHITNIAGDLNIRLVGMCQYGLPRQDEWCVN